MVDTSNAPASTIPELIQLILEMAKDPQKAEAFRSDPRLFLEARGVSEELKALVLSGRQGVESAMRQGALMQPTGTLTATMKTTNVIVVLVVVVVA